MADDILVKQDGPILRITLNAPDRGNAVTDDMVVRLTKMINEAGKTSDIVVLRGAGKDFCVGRAGMGSRPATEPTAYTRRNFSDVVFDAYGAMRNCPIPIIAVVQGGAHGFGCAIAAACDVTIASDKATFSVPEMAHQIMPTMVMSSFVDRVPRKAMAYLVYSMFEVTPERALSYGIVSDVVPAAQLDSHVDKLTAAMLKARNMVFSRPMVSETQPKNGRPKPSRMRSSERAKVSAAICRPNTLTGTSATLKSWAMGASWAAAIRPPEATITNTRYMTQKIGLRSTCGGVKSTLVCGRLSCFFFGGIATVGGWMKKARTKTIKPCPMPKSKKAA